MKTAQKNLLIDAIALVVYLIVANPGLTGIAVHEWLSLGVVVVLFVHCVVHHDWVVEVIRKKRGKRTPSEVANAVINLITLIILMIVVVSGLFISGTVLQVFGLYADGYFFWDPLHSVSAKVLLALLVVHVAMHAKWIYRFIRNGKGSTDDE